MHETKKTITCKKELLAEAVTIRGEEKTKTLP